MTSISYPKERAIPSLAPTATFSPARAEPAAPASSPLWPVVVLTYLLLLPSELRIMMGTFVMFPFRLFLILSLPWVVREFTNGKAKFGLGDLLVCVMIYWILFAMIITQGLERAISNGGSSAVDIGLTYFVGRCCINSMHSMKRYLELVAPAYFLAGLTVMAECLSGNVFVRPFFSKVFGVSDLLYTGLDGGNFKVENPDSLVQLRLGLARGGGPFPHPILAGLQLASLLPLYIFCPLPMRSRALGIAAAVFSVGSISSAAFISLFLTIFLIGYEYSSKFAPELNWRRFINITLIFMGILQIFTNSGVVGFVVNRLSFDHWSAYYRTLIWQYGSAAVRKNPWFGIGYGYWDRPSWMTPSVDNYWLNVAMNYGLPEAISRMAVIVIAIHGAAKLMKFRQEKDRELNLGLIISIAIMTLMGFTVAYWGTTQCWYFLLIGMLVGLKDEFAAMKPGSHVPSQHGTA